VAGAVASRLAGAKLLRMAPEAGPDVGLQDLHQQFDTLVGIEAGAFRAGFPPSNAVVFCTMAEIMAFSGSMSSER